MSPRQNWDSPKPSLASECASSPRTGGGGGAHSPAGEGLGESQSDDWRKSLAFCLLCGICEWWGTTSFWCRSGFDFPFSYWSRSGSDPKFDVCRKIRFFPALLFTALSVYIVLSFSSLFQASQLVLWTVYWQLLEKIIVFLSFWLKWRQIRIRNPDPNALDTNPDPAKWCRSDRIWIHNTGICCTVVYLYVSMYCIHCIDEHGTSIKAEI